MPLRHVLIAVLVAFIWGFNFIVIKIGLQSFPPVLFSALRFICAALPWAFLLGRGGVPWKAILQVGVTLGIIVFLLMFVGMDLGMPAGLSSLVLQSQVIFTLLFSTLMLRDRPRGPEIAGVGLGCFGIVMIGWDMGQGATLAGFLMVLGSGAAWGFSNIIMKRAGKVDSFRLTVWMCLVPPIPLLVLSALTERDQMAALLTVGPSGVAAVLYTGLVSTVFAVGLWAWLLRTYSPNRVAPFTLLMPVFGFLLSWLILGETLSAAKLVASAVVFAGVVLVVVGRQVFPPRQVTGLGTSP